MMKRLIACLVAGAIAGSAFAKLPPAPPMSDADKAAKAEKEAASKAKDAADLGKAQDKAAANYNAANYKKAKGVAEPKAASMAAKKK